MLLPLFPIYFDSFLNSLFNFFNLVFSDSQSLTSSSLRSLKYICTFPTNNHTHTTQEITIIVHSQIRNKVHISIYTLALNFYKYYQSRTSIPNQSLLNTKDYEWILINVLSTKGENYISHFNQQATVTNRKFK